MRESLTAESTANLPKPVRTRVMVSLRSGSGRDSTTGLVRKRLREVVDESEEVFEVLRFINLTATDLISSQIPMEPALVVPGGRRQGWGWGIFLLPIRSQWLRLLISANCCTQRKTYLYHGLRFLCVRVMIYLCNILIL